MNNYKASDIEGFMNEYEQYVTHVIVAHTKFHPYVNPQSKSIINNQLRIQHMAEQAKKDCRYALNVFSKQLYPTASNKPVRNPLKYKPLTLVTIEGAKETTDRAQTIHFNIAIGNLPKILTAEDIETLFRHAWCTKANQSSDIKVIKYFKKAEEACWIGYSLKEAQQDNKKAWTTDGIWDVSNCWIPHAALNAD